MVDFSSPGPNILGPEIIKVNTKTNNLMTFDFPWLFYLYLQNSIYLSLQPDITAPGVNILAAYPTDLSPTEFDFDKRRVAFNLMSGTSMSCPHISGVVGLFKTLHPDWSPSAIKSALMTTGKYIAIFFGIILIKLVYWS